MVLKVFRYRIVGLSGLLMNNPASMKSAGSKIPTPEKEAEEKVYRLDSGQLYIPAIAFRSSIIGRGGGASGRKFGKYTANSRVAAGVSMVDGEDKCLLVSPNGKPKPIKDYEIDIRRAVVNGAGIRRARPYIAEWATVVCFEVDEDFVTAEQLEELLNISGRVAGVMDFRPQCKGWFGKYRAELISE